jgi:hypothetical protein
MQPGPMRDAFTAESAESILDRCPAGIGPATYRLFEAMELGRVPVILSDEWVPRKGLDGMSSVYGFPSAWWARFLRSCQ